MDLLSYSAANMCSLQGKGRMTQKVGLLWAQRPRTMEPQPTVQSTVALKMKRMKEPEAQRKESRASKDYSQTLIPNGSGLARFQACLVLVVPLFPSISPFSNIDVCIIPVPPLYSGSNLFSRFTDEEKVCHRIDVTRVSPIHDLHDENLEPLSR